MKTRVMLPAFLALSGLALACAGGGFDGSYNLRRLTFGASGTAMLSPGNDSRVNLMLLLADEHGIGTAGLAYPDDSYDWSQNGRIFLDWRMLRAGMTAAKPIDYSAETPAYSGTRCAGFAAGSAALAAAMAANKALPAAEREQLMAARAQGEAVCKAASAWEHKPGQPIAGTTAWPAVESPAGREFLAYLQAADAFYAERLAEAATAFAGLARAGDPFVREAASYMQARAELAAAQSGAFGEYGDYNLDKVDRAVARRGVSALAVYLKAWPNGRYADSARGLQRRGAWLAGDTAALATTYAGMIAQVGNKPGAVADLVEEIDTKLPYTLDPAGSGRNAVLLAMNDLIAMRADEEGPDPAVPALTAAALDAQAPLFAGHEALFGYLQATHAYYYGRDYRRVLQLIPDDARRPVHTNLSFSRQVLRGMALAALRDRNEAGFWQELAGGAKGLWQRPLVELALAMNFERSGRLDAVFAPGSAVTEPTLRQILIRNSAPAPLLQRIVGQAALAPDERDLALYTLLSNELTHGQFAAFVADAALPVPAGSAATAAVFTRGKVGDGSYACAPLTVSVKALMAKPSDAPALLCLGEFFRINNQGAGGYSDPGPKADELGGFARGFTGRISGRAEFYDRVIADPAARPDDKAYALYRAVMCYAPSGSSECGPDVAKSQRKAWFDRLRSQYPNSPWTKKLRYYW